MKNLISGIDSWTWAKGREIKSRDIEFKKSQANTINAIVYGTYPYDIVLEKKGEYILGSCSCPAFHNDFECKHIAAVLYHLPAIFLSSLKPHKTYKFVFRNDEYFEEEEDFYPEDEDESSMHIPTVSRRKSTKPSIRNLEAELEEYPELDPVEVFYFQHDERPRGLQIWYLLEFSHYYNRSMTIYFKERQQLRNGQLGKLKSISLTSNSFKDLIQEDQMILRGMLPFLNFEFPNHIIDARIPSSEIERILPLIMSSGRVLSMRSEKNLEWIPAKGKPKLLVDSKKRSFKIEFEFSDNVPRTSTDVDMEGKYGLCHDSLFLIENPIPQKIYEYLSKSEGMIFNASDWNKLKSILLTHAPHAISGDKFGLKERVKEYLLTVHVKFLTLDTLALIVLENVVTSSDCVLLDNLEKKAEILSKIQEAIGISLEIGEVCEVQRSDLFRIVPVLNQLGIEIKSEKRKLKAISDFKFNVETNIDWFETEIDLGSTTNPNELEEILKAIKEKQQFVTMKNGDQVLLPDELIKSVERLARYSKFEKGRLITHKSRAMLLDELSESISFDEGFLKFRSNLTKFTSIKPVKGTLGMKAKLRDYQKLGVGWMEFLEKMEMGGCLADDMGLGKTIQVLAHLNKKKNEGRHEGVSLIVCPKSLVFNWINEAKKFCPNLVINSFSGGAWNKDVLQGADILVISYPLLQRNITSLLDTTFEYVILDEAQFIKNPSSLTAKSCYLLKAKHRLALTGTPVENYLGDLMRIFNFLIPGCFHAGLLSDRRTESEDLKFLKPFILRRTKEEVLTELPAKTVQVIYCDQTDQEKKFYANLRKLAIEGIYGEKNKIMVLAALMKLRQASCHAGLVESKNQKWESGKLDTLKVMVDEILEAGHKLIIFSQFTELLKLTRSYLSMDESNSSYLDGESKKREAIVTDFKSNPEKKCFFISIKAGGTGLNLTEANYCFILDPWWNPAVENQAIDRIHRMGQTSPVNAYRLITRNTIEEKVLELQERKGALAKEFMDGNEDFIRKMTKEDLEFLLTN